MLNKIKQYCEDHKEQELFLTSMIIMVNTSVASLSVALVSWNKYYWVMLLLAFLAMLSNAAVISQRKFTTSVYMFLISVVAQIVVTFITLY